MFYDIYCDLCKKKGVTPTRAAIEMGLSKSTPTAWKKQGITPQAAQLQKIASYFEVPIDYLMHPDYDPVKIIQNASRAVASTKKTPILSQKDERDIARDLERLCEALENGEDLMFDGDPMSDEARDSILKAMELGLRAAKKLNKETYTPRKYRKD